MANKKITDLTELTAANIANNDVLAIVDVGGNETKKVAISSLYDIFDNNVTIDTGKLVYGLTGANTNISSLSVNTLPLIGGTITGPVVSYSINSSSNVSIAQSLAIGYVDHRVPQANLDVKNNVYIGGATTIDGALTLGTDLAVTHGGTGASSLTDGGVLLGSGASAITAMGVLADGEVIVGDGTTDPVAESGATLRTSIGVGTGDAPQFYGANVSGNASINRSLAVGYTDGRVPQANLEVKGNAHITGATTIAGALTLGTDLAVTHGGTGASTLTDGGVLLGSGTSAITAMGVLGDGEVIVGDGSTDPVAESGATLRTSIGVGTGDTPQFYGANVTGNATIAGALTIGTPLAVAQGGTGLNSLTNGGVLLGTGTSAVTVMNVLTDGQMIVGDGTTAPGAESGDTLRNSIGVGSTASGTVMQIYSANVSGNVSVGRSLAVGDTDGRVPQANLEVKGNAHITGATTIAGVLNLLDNTLQRANLKDYGEVTSALGSAGGARTVDLEDGNSFSATISASTVTWTFSNPTASDELCGFTLTLVNGGSQTVNWPGSVDWAGGSAPSLTSSGTDILVFFTIDGGTIWHGMIASTDSK